jgi:hypothetical protein
MNMNHEDERLREALERIAPDPDDTGVLQTVVRRGRSLRTRRRVGRGVGALLIVALVALAGFGIFRLAQDFRDDPLPIAGSSASTTTTSASTTSTSASTTTLPPAGSIVYENTQFGFTFMLPESWKGYKIDTIQWEGFPVDTTGEGPGIFGPEISIRHPLWTEADPRQDIPIMIFTLEEWARVQQEKLSLGAAPIPPTELGRNSTYVFALPARYNFAFPTGYEEVEQILEGHPLKTTEPPPSSVDPTS